jgi:hypothetical protein
MANPLFYGAVYRENKWRRQSSRQKSKSMLPQPHQAILQVWLKQVKKVTKDLFKDLKSFN